MTKHLTLGRHETSDSSDTVRMPLDAVTRTFGVFGQRGTGKSTTAARMVEQAVRAGGRAVVLDPTGVWYGLTRQGTEPGLSGVVLGGEFADAPLDSRAGNLVAEFVVNSDYPVVVLDLKLFRKHERQHFAMEFLEALYHGNREPIMVVMDEAGQFAPTHMREKGDVPRLLGAVEDLVKLGRSRGLGAVMIEQRLATLNANVREQIETMVAHRMVGPLDRKALKEWIAAQGEPEREAEAMQLIPKLESGTALLWSPVFMKFFGVVHIANATTFDSRATPKVGHRPARPTARTPVDLDALKTRMAQTIEQAKANDPKELKREIARLRKELEGAGVATANAVRARTGEAISREHGMSVAAIRRLEAEKVRIEKHYRKIIDVLQSSFHKMTVRLDKIRGLAEWKSDVPAIDCKRQVTPPTELVADLAKIASDAAVREIVKREDKKVFKALRDAAGEGDITNGTLARGEKAVLIAAAQYDGVSREQITVLTGYKRSTRDAYIHRLGLKGYVMVAGQTGDILATTEGKAALGDDYEPLPTGQALRDYWMRRLPEGERVILSFLIEQYDPSDPYVTRDALNQYKRSTRDAYIHRLKAKRLVEADDRGHVAASAILFE